MLPLTALMQDDADAGHDDDDDDGNDDTNENDDENDENGDKMRMMTLRLCNFFHFISCSGELALKSTLTAVGS